MIIFVLNIKKELSHSKIKKFLSEVFGIDEGEVKELTENNHKALTNYYLTTRTPSTEFNCELVINVTEELCLSSGVYNNLLLAIPLSNLIACETVIHDQSNDPGRWILIDENTQIFIVHEIVYKVDQYGFIIDRTNMKRISEQMALAVLPSRDYVAMKPEDRPVFFNNSDTWKRL